VTRDALTAAQPLSAPSSSAMVSDEALRIMPVAFPLNSIFTATPPPQPAAVGTDHVQYQISHLLGLAVEHQFSQANDRSLRPGQHISSRGSPEVK